MKLLLAFASTRRRSDVGTIYFYEHDGVSQGKLVEGPALEPKRSRSDHHPSLSADGRYCAFASQFREVLPSELRVWDAQAKTYLELPGVNGNGALAFPSLSADGRFLAFAGWKRSGGVGGWDVFLFDLREKRLLDLPGVNSEHDEQMPALSGDGRFLTFVSNRPAGGSLGLSRIYMYDRSLEKLVSLPGLSESGRDVDPSLSAEGRYLAFASSRAGREGESGNGDLYLYDCREARLVNVPGLNTPAMEASPSLSADGRFISFVSERLSGEGQRDIYLYDRRESRVVPLPGLNHLAEDFDPAVAVLPG